MEKRYKEIDGVRYQVIQNTILGSNVVPVGESLPEVTTSDNGKLLGVSSGEWTPVDAPSNLPDITGNAGKVLKVNAGATGTEWANETTELPAVTAADEGDVLTVNASGQWSKATPSGGLTLYGPYSATNSRTETILPSGDGYIDLNNITDLESNEYQYDATANYFIGGISFGAPIGNGLSLLGYWCPSFGDGGVPNFSIGFFNSTDASITLPNNGSVLITFYTTKELQHSTP